MHAQEQIIINTANRLLASTPAAAVYLPLADGKALYMGSPADIASMLPDQSGAAVRGEAVATTDWREKCEALIDIWDDAQKNPPESRCYFEHAWPDMLQEVRAALCAKVSARAADAPSEPSELVKELRMYADDSGYSHNDYADIMRRAADALDSQPTENSGSRCPCDSSGTCQDVCPDPATGLPLCASVDCYSTRSASQPKVEDMEEDAQGEIRKVHHLKTDPAVFFAVARGAKTHEIRLNDRDFQVGDRLVLAETESTGSEMRSFPKLYPLVYTGRTESRIVSHIQTGYGLADGWCILSFRAPAAQASATIQAALEEIVRLRTVQSIGFKLTAALCQIASVRKSGIDYVPREAVMDVVVEWRNKHDEASKVARNARSAAAIQEPVMVAEPVGFYVSYSDDEAVDLFAAAMKAKMNLSREKGRSGWNDPEECSAERLREMLFNHIRKGDPVDVGSFAMMLWNRDESTAAPMVAERYGKDAVFSHDIDKHLAAPMVADPAGVARQALIDLRALHIGTLSTPTHFNAYLDIIDKALAATVKAVPSEARIANLEAALRYYAEGNHFMLSDPDAWDTVSGEPFNFQCDEAGTATLEDGSIAKMVLAGEPMPKDDDEITVTVTKSEGADAAPLADKTGGGE